MKSVLVAGLAVLLLAVAVPASANTDQLRQAIRFALTPLDPDVDIDALDDQQVIELYLVLRGTKLTYEERRRKIRAATIK